MAGSESIEAGRRLATSSLVSVQRCIALEGRLIKECGAGNSDAVRNVCSQGASRYPANPGLRVTKLQAYIHHVDSAGAGSDLPSVWERSVEMGSGSWAVVSCATCFCVLKWLIVNFSFQAAFLA
jgi:hypothetical protein